MGGEMQRRKKRETESTVKGTWKTCHLFDHRKNVAGGRKMLWGGGGAPRWWHKGRHQWVQEGAVVSRCCVRQIWSDGQQCASRKGGGAKEQVGKVPGKETKWVEGWEKKNKGLSTPD